MPWQRRLITASFLCVAAVAVQCEVSEDAYSTPAVEIRNKGQCQLQVQQDLAQQNTSSKETPELAMAGKGQSMTCTEACAKLDDKIKEAALIKTRGGTSPITSPLEPSGCEPYCVGACPCLKVESERCSVRSCSNCSFCLDLVTPAPTPAPTGPGPDGSMCFPGASEVADLDVSRCTIVTNNLGDVGPDRVGPPELRCQGIGFSGGQTLDLVVTVAPGSSYRPRVPASNGMNNAGLFQVNFGSGLRGQGIGEQATLTFTFQATGTTQEVILPAFYFTVLDVDQYGDFANAPVQERVHAWGFDSFLVEPENDMEILQPHPNEVSLTSQRLGTGCDNPDEPMNLHIVDCNTGPVNQRKRAVTFLYKNRASFNLTFDTICNQCRDGGRNFRFAANSSLTNLCR